MSAAPSEPALVHVGLGANLGDPERSLALAADALEALPGVVAAGRSSLWAAAPVGPPQPEYRNAVVALRMVDTPEAFLGRLLALERAHGRVRDVRWGPRTLDLDILLWGERVVAAPGLRVPHPELHRRRFVLEPLAELAPGARHPLLGKTVAELLAAVTDQDVRPLSSAVWSRR